MKFFKSTILMFLIIIISSTCLGCGPKEAYYKIAGKKLAQAYIKDKYGFDGEIVDVRLGISSSYCVNFPSSYSGEVYVKMKHDTREFIVYTDARINNSHKCYDNYQLPEIQEAVKSIITNHTKKEPAAFYFVYGAFLPYEGDDNGLITSYYDGNNLDDIINKDMPNIVSVIEYTGDVDLNKFNNFRFSNENNETLIFVNYKNSDAMRKIQNHSYYCPMDGFTRTLYENSAYIKNAKMIENGTVTDYPMDSASINMYNNKNKKSSKK